MTSISASRAVAGPAASAFNPQAAEQRAEQSAASRFADTRIHFIGIGGCGMSGLAFMLKQLGAICSGSDAVGSELTESLDAAGIPVCLDQTSATIGKECDLVIASAAIKPDHPEMLAAQERNLPVWTYAEALGRVQQDRTGISIAGTHGKSTTTAMLAHVLIECGFDPSFIVGATCPQIGGGSRTGAAHIPKGQMAGKPGTLLAEACEFNRSFHHHCPLIGLINNIEEDHLDIYGSLDEIITAFRGFAERIPPATSGGRLLIAHEGAQRGQVTLGLACAIATFGFHPEADYQVVYDAAVRPGGRVGVMEDGVWLAQWTAQMPGAHNALNSAAAGILASWLGADWEEIAAALESFRGIDRRMQKLGTRKIAGGEVIVYDDYGHHPTEIENTLRALRAAELSKGGAGRLICVFQPHQHSRTRFLMEQFAQSFSSADVVIVPHIYFVRDSEVEKTKVSAADLVDRLRGRGVQAMHLYPFEAIVEQLEILARPGDLIVIMGAGPVWKVAKAFLERA